MEKSANISAGDPSLLNKLYDLSLALPEDALVTQFRFTDGDLNMNIQTQNRSDISQRLHFPYWRIKTINQRIVSDTVITYTISLVKQDQSEVQK